MFQLWDTLSSLNECGYLESSLWTEIDSLHISISCPDQNWQTPQLFGICTYSEGSFLLFTSEFTQFFIARYTPFRYKRDNLFHYFSLMKSLENAFYFLTNILPDFVTHESSKEFWKNSHFENMRAGFLLMCQNSLRQTTPWNHAFSAMKKIYFNQYYVLALDPIKI